MALRIRSAEGAGRNSVRGVRVRGDKGEGKERAAFRFRMANDSFRNTGGSLHPPSSLLRRRRLRLRLVVDTNKQNKARRDETGRDGTSQDKTRQGKARQGKASQGKPRQAKPNQGKTHDEEDKNLEEVPLP